MKKVALLFVLAVFVPSLVLACLAIRSLRDQQLVLERQQSLLYQGVAESLAKEVSAEVRKYQRQFAQQVEQLLAAQPASELAAVFDSKLVQAWPLAEVGFAVALDGSLLSPSLLSRPDARRFRLENERFLTSRETVDIQWDHKAQAKAKEAARSVTGSDSKTSKDVEPDKAIFATKAGKVPVLATNESTPDPATMEGPAEFRQLIGDSMEGTIARFLQDTLKMLLWYRSPRDPHLVFGAQLDMHKLTTPLAPLLQVEPSLRGEIMVALLDESGEVAASSARSSARRTDAAAVVIDVGPMLPHWQIAVWPLHPDRLNRSATTLQLFLGLLVGLLMLAISMGGWLIVQDLRRQLTLARQKTDFVSNVSHELKTPLTSIRMFSELLAEGKIQDESKRRHYLQIITAETARLTRLINNVLDFARLERGEKKYQFQRCDLVTLVRNTVATYRPHLEEAGFRVECQLPARAMIVLGDQDALAQVLVNLLSNAEKYAGESKEVVIEVPEPHSSQKTVEVRVLDRGLGIPPGCEEKIFEQFYRAHDSLGSGIQGSGLGLTLARQIARSHHGELSYQARPGGGSCFTVTLPLASEPDAHANRPVPTKDQNEDIIGRG